MIAPACETPGGMKRVSRASPAEAKPSPTIAAEKRKKNAFDQELFREAKAIGAEREAKRDLFLPAGGAGEEKIGDVRTSDEENERHRAEEHEQGWFHVADDLLMQRQHRRADARVLSRILLGQSRGDGFHLDLRLRERDAGLHARDHLR